MALAFDAATTNKVTSGTSISFSHTTGTGNDRLLVVCFMSIGNTALTFSNVTYGGVALTQAIRTTETDDNGYIAEIWYLIAPASGANTVVATLSTAIHVRTTASSYTGAAQTSVLETTGFDKSATVQGNASTTITTSAKSVLIDCVVHEGGSLHTLGAGQTALSRTDEGVWDTASSYEIQSAAGATTMNWTGSTDFFAQSVAAFKEAPSGVLYTQTLSAVEVSVPTITKAVNNPPTVALNTTDALSTTDTTPTIEFTGTDAQGDDIRYNVQISDQSDFALNTDTYYFDGSDAAATDPNNVWTNDANAFDGNTGTEATTTTIGDTTGWFLKAEGTNAPASGSTISSVRARIYSDSFGSYVTLNTPSGGWTWEKLQALEVKIYNNGGEGNNVSAAIYTDALGELLGTPTATGTPTASVARVEIEVTSGTLLDKLSGTDAGFVNTVNGADTDPFTSGQKVSYTVQSALAIGTYYYRVRAKDPSGTNTYGAWSETRSIILTSAIPTDKALSVVEISVTNLATRVTRVKSLTLTEVTVPTLTRKLTYNRTLAATEISVPAITRMKKAFKTVAASLVGVPVILCSGKFYKTLTIAAISNSTISAAKTYTRTLNAVGLAITSLSTRKKGIISLSTVEVSVLAITRISKFYRTLNTNLVSIPTIIRFSKFYRNLQATLVSVPVLTAQKTILQSLQTSVLGVATISFLRTTIKNLSAVVSGVPTLSDVATYFRNLSTTLITVPSLVRSNKFYRNLQATIVFAPVLAKMNKFYKILSATEVSVPTISKRLTFLKNLLVAEVFQPVMVLVNVRVKSLSITSQFLPTLTRRATFYKTLIATLSTLSSLTTFKKFYRSLSAAVVGVASLAALKAYFQTISATLVTNASMSRRKTFVKILSATLSPIISVGRGVKYFVSLAGQLVIVPTLTDSKKFYKTLAVSITGVPVITAAKIYYINMLAQTIGNPVIFKDYQIRVFLSALVQTIVSISPFTIFAPIIYPPDVNLRRSEPRPKLVRVVRGPITYAGYVLQTGDRIFMKRNDIYENPDYRGKVERMSGFD